MHTTKEWLNIIILSGSPHLLKCSIIDSRNVLSRWINPSKFTSVSPAVFLDECLLLKILSSSTLPPYSQGEVQPPLVVMRHPSYDSSGPRFVLHLDKKRQHAGDSAVDVVTAETEETSVFLPFYTRTAPGCWRARWCCVACPLLRALSQSGECAWKPGHYPRTGVTLGEATIQGRLYPGHTTGRCYLHMFTTLVISHKRFPTEIMYYAELENSGGLWCSSIERGGLLVLNRINRYMKTIPWYQ